MTSMTTGNKIMWKRGEITPKEQFLLFSTLLYIYNFRSQITYSFVKCGCSIYCIILTLSTLICRGMDISKCFSESLGIRDNESRLYYCYLQYCVTVGYHKIPFRCQYELLRSSEFSYPTHRMKTWRSRSNFSFCHTETKVKDSDRTLFYFNQKL